jgi:predicted amidophosphoribosyltransferase
MAMNKEKVVVTNCCECGMPFRALGEGNYVTCPHCGAELSFTPIRSNRFSKRNEPQYDPSRIILCIMMKTWKEHQGSMVETNILTYMTK